jgi:hypothetical protein
LTKFTVTSTRKKIIRDWIVIIVKYEDLEKNKKYIKETFHILRRWHYSTG